MNKIISFFALVAMATGLQAQNLQNGHEYVDLGLPSGTMWATCNIGAEAPERMGDKYAWGETEPKAGEGTWLNYKFGTERYLTKYTSWCGWPYNDNKVELDDTDDAAQVNWGGTWRMPTIAQFNELNENCTIRLSFENVGNNKKRYGILFTSKINEKSIFFPVTDYVDADWDYGIDSYAVNYYTKNRGEVTVDEVWAYSFFLILIYGGRAECWEEHPLRYEANLIRPVFVAGDVVPTHTHSYASGWRMDANTHWHACESPLGVCHATKSGKAAHTYNSDNTCIDCGYTTNHTHYYSFFWVWDANSHWHHCESPCGTCDAPKADEAAHDFDEEYGFCNVCGYRKSTTHTHSYATTWSWNENTHWHACTSTEGYCNAPKADEAAHSFGTGYICTVCGYEIPLVNYNIYVASTQVTSRNMYDVLGDGKVSYAPATNTLTLNGANIQAKSGIHGYGIQAEEDNMKIKLLGYNTITTTNRNGIRIKGTPDSGPITILGGGLLFITSSTAGFLSYNDVILTDGVKIIVENIGTSSGGFDGMKQSTSAPFPTLTMSGTGTVLRAKGGPNGSVHNFHALNLLDGIKIFEPEGAIFVEDEGIKKNGAMVANEWVTIGNKDFIDGVNNPNANHNLNEGMFNLAGQRVDSKYKGVVIKGGKKVWNK